MKVGTERVFPAMVLALLLSASIALAAQQNPNFAGTWQMTVAGRGGQGGGGERGRGGPGYEQTLVITQDGGKAKVIHKTPRDEQGFDATISGNTISWTEERPGRHGETLKIEYKATIDGDTLNGTMGGEQFSRNFTAKRQQ